MSFRNVLAAGALTLSLIGCENRLESSKRQEYATIKGVPISVEIFNSSTSESYLATVLDKDGKRVLAYVESRDFREITETAALIKAEILDGDREPIQLSGKYNGYKFAIKEIKTNGYQFNF